MPSTQEYRTFSVPLSRKTKGTLKESWKLVEPVKTEAGKAMFMRWVSLAYYATEYLITDQLHEIFGTTLPLLLLSNSRSSCSLPEYTGAPNEQILLKVSETRDLKAYFKR